MLLLFFISLAVGSKMSKRLLVSSVVTIRNFYDTLSLSHKTLTRFKKKWKMFLKVWSTFLEAIGGLILDYFDDNIVGAFANKLDPMGIWLDTTEVKPDYWAFL